MEQKLIDLKNRLDTHFKDRDKEQTYKSFASYTIANTESLDILESHDIYLKKPSQVIVLSIEPKDLERQVKLAEEMGFVAAYKQNPRFLTQPIEMVIKRMAKADAIGVTYKNEEGIYASFIFSQRAFEHIISQVDVKKNELNEDVNVVSNLSEHVMHLIEEFSLQSEKDNIFARLNDVSKSDLSEKEILMEIFKNYVNNDELLADKIDIILELNSDLERGRIA